MKILMINDYGIEIGGAETYLKNLKNGLLQEGHEVRVLTSRSADDIPTFSDYTFQGLNVNSPFRLFPYVFNLDSYRKVKHIIKEFKPDVVHLHFIFYHTSPSVLMALKNIPTVMTLHAHEVLAPVGVDYSSKCNHPFIGYCIKCTGPLKLYPEIIKRIIFRSLSKRINLFIAPSNYYAQIHKKAGYSPVLTVYNGIIGQADYKPVDSNNQNMLFIGRLAVEKGAEYPIRALPLIHKEFPNATLTIVGDGPESEKLKQLIDELNLNKYVTMTGKIPNEETGKYYQNASIVIVPPTYPDNLPTVCIEAMNNGRPIVASNLGGLPELVTNDKNGFLFNAGDYKEIATKVIKIFSDRTLHKKLSHGSRETLNKFRLENHIKNITYYYNKLKT